jgi:hypothetical protein
MNVNLRTNTTIKMHMKMKLNLKMSMKRTKIVSMKMNMSVKMRMMTLQMGIRCSRFAGYVHSQIKAAGEDEGHSTKVPTTSHRMELG